MSEVGIQLAPRARPNVVFGRDPDDPDRFIVRSRYLRPSAALALVVVFFAAASQLRALRDEEIGSLLASTLVVWGGLAGVLLRKRLVFDRRLRELREEFSLVFPFAHRRRPSSRLRCVSVSLENRAASQGSETLYPVDLEASSSRLRVDSVGQWEHAMPLAEALARFLRLPLRDTRRGGALDPETLDAAVRDELPPGVGPAPQGLKARISADRPGLLRVTVPRPAVPQTLFLNGVVLAFCLFPFLVEFGIPWLRGRRFEIAEALPLLGLTLLPILIVGTGSLRHVSRNGGTLSVTPESVRFVRNGLWRKKAVEIPAEKVEDLTILEPEMGGSRSLLAYFSDGVLVARSDTASFRVGYGLATDELEWMRDRAHEVLRQGLRRPGPAAPGIPLPPAEEALPVFPRWSVLWLSTLAGGVLGRLVGGPLAAGLALPFLEEVLNVGALLGFAAGAASSVSIWRNRSARGVLLGLTCALLTFTSYLLFSGSDLAQPAPRFDEDAALTGATVLARPEALASPERTRVGYLVAGGLANALLLNGVLLLLFRLKGGDWALAFSALLAEGGRAVRSLTRPPTRIALLLAATAAIATVLFHVMPAGDPGYRLPWQLAPPAAVAEYGPPSDSRAGSGPAEEPGAGSPSRLLLPLARPPIAPWIETTQDLDEILRGLEGRPILLFFWSGDRTRAFLPDVDRLHRLYGPKGVEVIGIPQDIDEARLHDRLAAARIEWRQLLGAPSWRSRIPTRWPQIVLLDERGKTVYSGEPGRAVDEALSRLIGAPTESASESLGVVTGRLTYAGRPLHETTREAPRFWFRDEWSGKVAEPQVEVDRRSSRFVCVAPLGTYAVEVSAGPRLDFEPHASLIGSGTMSVAAGEPQPLEVALQRILRLRQPVDNARTLPPLAEAPVHASPVRFAWDALPEATAYRYSVSRTDDPSTPAISGETGKPEVTLTLATGRYRFRLSAHGAAGLVGRLEVYGADFRAWSYEFVVGPAPPSSG